MKRCVQQQHAAQQRHRRRPAGQRAPDGRQLGQRRPPAPARGAEQLAQGGDAGSRKVEEGEVDAVGVEWGEVKKKGLPHSGAAQHQGPSASCSAATSAGGAAGGAPLEGGRGATMPGRKAPGRHSSRPIGWAATSLAQRCSNARATAIQGTSAGPTISCRTTWHGGSRCVPPGAACQSRPHMGGRAAPSPPGRP